MNKLLLIATIYIISPTLAIAQSNAQGALGVMSGAGGLGEIAKKNSEPQIQPVIKIIQESKPDNLSQLPPSGSYEEFLYYEKQSKSNQGVACVIAGKIMTAEVPPKDIFDLSSTTRANRAIRLYEAGISQGNLEAMELAYDLYYDQNVINRQLNSYTDKDRAKELMDGMIVKNYAGGRIRLARDYIENPEYAVEFGKKKEACRILKEVKNQPNLTDSTKKIVLDLDSGLICKIAG